jgi:hypothetical protein
MSAQFEILGRSVERARAIAAGLLCLAILLMVAGVAVEGAIGTIIAALGSTAATTALVSFLYDPFLKEVLAQEIFSRVGLRDSIARAGLEDVATGPHLDLRPGIESSRNVRAMPLDPFAWARETFPAIVTAAHEKMNVVIALPSPDPGPARELLAERLQLGESEIERRLKQLPEELARAWDRGPINSGSTFAVVTHGQLVATGLLISDRMVVIETGPSLGQSITDNTTLVQRFRRDAVYGEWAAAQMQEAIDHAALAIVRPVTAADGLPRGSSSEGLRTAAAEPTDEAVPGPTPANPQRET